MSDAEPADLNAAKKVAATYASELLLAAPERLWRDGDWNIYVRDNRGIRLLSIVILGMLAPAGREVTHADVYDAGWNG